MKLYDYDEVDLEEAKAELSAIEEAKKEARKEVREEKKERKDNYKFSLRGC